MKEGTENGPSYLIFHRSYLLFPFSYLSAHSTAQVETKAR